MKMTAEFTLNVKQGDTLYVPISIKQNDKFVHTGIYEVTAYVLNKVIKCQNISSQTKILNIKAEDNDFIDGTYTLYLVLERNTGERKTVTGQLIVQKGKINGQS